MGRSKLLLEYHGCSLLRHITKVALEADADATLVVLGADLARLRRELSGLAVQIVENSQWRNGMSTSVKAALEALPPTADAALFLLADQPRVTAQLLNDLMKKFRCSGKPIVASEYRDTVGVPALISRSLFPELTTLEHDQGAKRVILAHLADVVRVPFPEGAMDVDTAEDYGRLVF